jgi:Tat protein translocase TatB subunit
MFGSLGGSEIILILIIGLIVFGPRKLPEIGKSVGKMLAEFRRASADFRQTIESEVEAEKLKGLTSEATAAAAPAPQPAQEPAPAPLVDIKEPPGETVSRGPAPTPET